jgi:uncharacterized protein YdaU (DUF1376 family)
MADKAPAFQFYPKDFLSDENQAVMTCEQAGAFIRLLCHAWNEGSIPDDAEKCARLAAATVKGFSERVWPAVRVCFTATTDGRLVHRRLEKERIKQDEFRAAAARAGKLSAASKRERLFNGRLTVVQRNGSES